MKYEPGEFVIVMYGHLRGFEGRIVRGYLTFSKGMPFYIVEFLIGNRLARFSIIEDQLATDWAERKFQSIEVDL